MCLFFKLRLCNSRCEIGCSVGNDKQASDDEDNEIEIVEPKTDTITLDSDNDDDEPPQLQTQPIIPVTPIIVAKSVITTAVSSTTPNTIVPKSTVDLMSAAQNFLASMLEVDMVESDQTPVPQSSPVGSDTASKKQPRKKLTNKPNPTLLKQKELLERDRLEEMKRNDTKLKMKCSIELMKAEEEFPFAKDMLNEKEKKVHDNAERIESKENVVNAETDAEAELELVADKKPRSNSTDSMEEVELILMDEADSQQDCVVATTCVVTTKESIVNDEENTEKQTEMENKLEHEQEQAQKPTPKQKQEQKQEQEQREENRKKRRSIDDERVDVDNIVIKKSKVEVFNTDIGSGSQSSVKTLKINAVIVGKDTPADALEVSDSNNENVIKEVVVKVMQTSKDVCVIKNVKEKREQNETTTTNLESNNKLNEQIVVSVWAGKKNVEKTAIAITTNAEENFCANTIVNKEKILKMNASLSGDVDVDKAIEKILIDGLTESGDEEDKAIAIREESHEITENKITTTSSSSPDDLFHDINELIEKESNATIF